MTRLLHPPERVLHRVTNEFDPVVEGPRYRLTRELSLAIWERVCADATDSLGRLDQEQAERRFHEIAVNLATRGGRLRPDVGRLTRVGTELDGVAASTSVEEVLAVRAPGRETLVAAEARRWAELGKAATADTVAAVSRNPSGPPAASDLPQARATLRDPQSRDRATALEPGIGARMCQLFDVDFDLARVAGVPDRAAVMGSTKGVMKGDEAHLRADAAARAQSALLPLAPLAALLGGGQPSALDRVLSRGLHEVLVALFSLHGGRGLVEATLSAAMTSRGQPARSLLPRPRPAAAGQAMWRVAERRAAILYRRELNDGTPRIEDPAVEDALARIGGGQPLPVPVRRAMEVELGASFDRVRVHTDAVASEAAYAVHAQAFTVGEDIFFAAGAFAPETPSGRELLVHELVHVVQGYQGRVASGPRGVQVSRQDESLEREADSIAQQISARRSRDRVAALWSAPGVGSRPAPAPAVWAREAHVAAPSVLLRQPDPSRPLSGMPVQKLGIVYRPEGVDLHEHASSHGGAVRRLAFNTRVFVDSQERSWYFVTTSDGHFGHVAATDIKINLPEPDAKIHWIKAGDTALSISHKYYGGNAEWGSDHRFYVNGLVYVNQGPGRRGIFKSDANAGWETTQVIKDYMIWIPSLSFLQSLHGKVSSGSITYEAWQSVKSAAEAVGDVLLGAAAFIAGVLHGALESLWDVLVGLKDLAVMIWDILKSAFSGDLMSDAAGLWNDLRNLDWKKLVTGWIDGFEAKWNADGIFKRWHFRGWVIGYVVMEVLLLVFSEGVIQGIKWIGKASKVAKVIEKLPRLEKLAKTVKASKAYQKVAEALGRGGKVANKSDAVKWIEHLLHDPKSVWGKGPEEIADAFRKAGHEAIVEQSKKGSKLSKQIRIKGGDINNIQVHPGGGRHGGAYYKISSSTKGVIKVVDRATYVATPGEKATIIFMSGPEGWLLQAAAANSAAQRAGHEVGTQIDPEDD